MHLPFCFYYNRPRGKNQVLFMGYCLKKMPAPQKSVNSQSKCNSSKGLAFTLRNRLRLIWEKAKRMLTNTLFRPFYDIFCIAKKPEKIISQTKCNCGCIYFDKKMTCNFSSPPLTTPQNMLWESHRRRGTQKYKYNFNFAFVTLL